MRRDGPTLAEACGEALRQGLRSAWVWSKLHVLVGLYALVAPIILEKDIAIEGACSKQLDFVLEMNLVPACYACCREACRDTETQYIRLY